MPKPIEIAFHQFGVRLTQAKILYEAVRAVNPLPPPYFGSLRTGEHEVLIRYAIAALNSAFDQLAETARLASVLIDGGKALIQDCDRRWQNCLELSRAAQREGYDRTYPLFSENITESIVNLRNLQSLAQRVVMTPGPDKGRAEPWYKLGLEICTGEPSLCRPHHVKLPSPAKDKVMDELLSMEISGWDWVPPTKLAHLLAEAGGSFEQLCPKVSEEQVTILPYDPSKYERWFRAEAGLDTLVRLLPAPILKASQAEASSNAGRIRLRLTVDIKGRIATYDGKPYSLPDETAAYFVATLVAAKGDWMASKDIFTKESGHQGARPDRIKSSLKEPIRSLVETQDGKGSRIPISKLLAQDSLPEEWRDPV